MFNLLSFAMYRSMYFELKYAVNSVDLKLMLAPFISYSLSAVLACQHGGVNRMGHATAGALYGCQVSTYVMTPRPQMTLCLSLCLVYSINSPGSYSHMSLGFESVHVIAWRDCTCSHTVRVKYRKGTYSVTIITSVP